VPSENPGSHALGLTWLTVVLPFAVLPPLTIAHNQDAVDVWWQSHLFFHVAYIPFLLAAAYVTRDLAATSPTNALRRLAVAITVLQLVALIGHVGELIAVLRDGGLDSGEDIYTTTEHEIFGTATPLLLLVSVALVVAISLGRALVKRRYDAG
jgi:hypothetical protein